jgi:EAL domain-containing protein (putative c-di-GMP-specific phosphodiesterase class I)
VDEPSQSHILVVDDEPDLLEVYGAILDEAGYRVHTARDGRAAVEILAGTEFDLVLTDISMPDMNGVDVLRAVRGRDLDVPVILVTGSPTLESAVQALDLGALRYLVKPVTESALKAVVADGVRLHRLAKLKRQALTHLGSEKLVGDRAGLEASLARALASMRLAYQPIVRAADRQVFGQEALLRSAEASLPSPTALIEAAERLGRVLDLGRAVRERVAQDGRSSHGNVFVNLHTLELTDETLYSADSPLSRQAGTVILEVTERASLDGVPALRERVKTLRALGFRLAVDDMGAGYAGLTSFAALEPDLVKLDMSLVRGVDAQPIKRKLIGSMTQLCKDLGILVVAEGVETVAELGVVTDLGCDLIQGFLIGRPV